MSGDAKTPLFAAARWRELRVLIDRLEGLDALTALCGTDDELYTAFATFPLPDGNYLNLQVVTTAAGHRVDGESRLPVDIEEIGRGLGLELAEAR